MFKRMKRRSDSTVEFSEAQGRGYQALRRENELIDRQRTRAMLRGWKLV